MRPLARRRQVVGVNSSASTQAADAQEAVAAADAFASGCRRSAGAVERACDQRIRPAGVSAPKSELRPPSCSPTAGAPALVYLATYTSSLPAAVSDAAEARGPTEVAFDDDVAAPVTRRGGVSVDWPPISGPDPAVLYSRPRRQPRRWLERAAAEIHGLVGFAGDATLPPASIAIVCRRRRRRRRGRCPRVGAVLELEREATNGVGGREGVWRQVDRGVEVPDERDLTASLVATPRPKSFPVLTNFFDHLCAPLVSSFGQTS
jgi:hypothetical protein